ncbi:MAG: ribbon-helix-helix domain-containing protein [Alphaproteobacteria bacterium]
MPSSLMNKNVVVNGRRTSVRLEGEMWDALGEIARRERCTIHHICSDVESRRKASTFAAGLRVYIMSYYREAADRVSRFREASP